MATLQNIRNRGGVLIAVVIGLALGAFILGDMLNSGSKLMKPSQMRIAEIDGESVQYPDFQKKFLHAKWLGNVIISANSQASDLILGH